MTPQTFLAAAVGVAGTAVALASAQAAPPVAERAAQQIPAPAVVAEFRAGNDSWHIGRTDTAFRIGSVTKTFTAAAVLESGIDLDDTVAHWLPGVLPKLDTDRITVRDLLRHTAGVPDDAKHPRTSPARYVKEVDDQPPKAPPGTFAYSNGDYWVLAMILHRATGRTYREAIDLRGLPHTRTPANTFRLPRPHLPTNVRFNAAWGSSSGGMISTTHDLNRFSRHLLRSPLARTMKQGVEVPNNPMGVSRYGLGLVTVKLGCVTVYGNMGGQAVFTTWMLSDGDRSLAIGANADETPRMDRAMHGLAEAAFC